MTQVLVQRLAIDHLARGARLLDRQDALARRRVDKVHRRPFRLGQQDRPRERQVLGQLRVHQMEVRASSATLLIEQLVVELDQVVVFGVDDHDATARGDQLHQPPDPTEIHFVRRGAAAAAAARCR